MNSCGPLPFISPWLYRMTLKHVIRRGECGEVDAVRELADVICSTSNTRTLDLALHGLSSLPSADQIDHLCRIILAGNNPTLMALADDCRYSPSAPAERALYCFCTSGPAESGTRGPHDNYHLLAKGYAGASAQIRARVLRIARKNGTRAMLSRALTGTLVTRSAGDWSYDEWDLVIAGMVDEQRWGDLWLLAPMAPISLAVRAITAIRNAGWTPGGDDLLLWEGITAALPDRWEYPVPGGTLQRTVGRLASQVTRLGFSPDGTLIATGSCDGMITVYRTASAGLMREISMPDSSIRLLTIAADNTHLVYGGDDGAVHCHSLQDNLHLWSWDGPSPATVLSVSADNRSVLLGDGGGTLHVLGLHDGQVLYSRTLHPSPVTCLDQAHGGSPVVCGHTDGTVSWYHFGETGNPGLFTGISSPVRSVAICPQGLEILAVYERAPPILWDLTTGTRSKVFSGNTGQVACCAALGENRGFALGSSDHMLRFWDQRGNLPQAAISLYNRQITCCSAVPDGSLLTACFHEGTIRIYRMPGAHLVREFKGHKKTITSCAIAPDGTRLATVSWDGTTRLWQLPKGEILRTWDTHNGRIAALAGPAGTLIATVTKDGIARIYDSSDGSLIRTIDLYTPEIKTAAMSADGTYLASAGANATLRLWNIHDGGLVAASDHLPASQRCCSFLPGNSGLITGGWDGVCRLFSVPDAMLLRTFSGHTSIVTCCAISRDGSFFVTGSNDTTVRLWNTSGGEAYAVLRESGKEVGAVALSPDETLLATGSAGGVIRLYDLPSGIPAGEIEGNSGKITSLVFTPDNCILAAGYDSGVCTVLSLTEKKLINTIPAHSGAITGMAILADSRTLVTTGDDGLCRFHPLPYAPFLAHTDLSAFAEAVREERSTGGSPACAQWTFLRTLLAARFQGEIEICAAPDVAGLCDIQIVG